MSSATSADTSAATPSISENHQQLLRYGSLAILGGYAVAIAYRVGLVQKVLPKSMYDKLEGAVEHIKSKTKPLGDAKRFALARAHLTSTYTLTSVGMTAFVAGVLTFVAAPKVPIVVPVITSVVSLLLVVAVPKQFLLRPYRILCLVLCYYSAGYTFGPLGWVAQDSLFLFLMCTFCTMAGLVTPLFLTRGLISYLLSSQLLSLTLSVSFFTAPKEAKLAYSPFNILKQQSGVQMILSADYNVLLTLQLICNCFIVVLHTIPSMYYFVTSKCDGDSKAAKEAAAASWDSEANREGGLEEERVLLDSVDDVREAFCICAGWSYLLYRIVKHYARFFVEKVINENNDKKKHNTNKQDNAWQMLADRKVNLSGASGVCSGLMMVLLYIKAVSLLQRSDPTASLEQFRRVCHRISPLEYLLKL